MKNIIRILTILAFTYSTYVDATVLSNGDRALWGSICGRKDAMLGSYQSHLGKVLVSWRMLPGDDATTAFDLYRNDVRIANNLHQTNYQDTQANLTQDNTYRITYAGKSETLSTYTMTATQAKAAQPYVSIPLKDTRDVCDLDTVIYRANDCSVGDLDGDGEMEIVVKRLLCVLRKDSLDKGVTSLWLNGQDPQDVPSHIRHHILWEAYKLDGTFLWRVKSGPNIILGNSSCFGVADLDGDGYAEVVTRTAEGFVFGDGQEIGDTDGDGKTDYRKAGLHYMGEGPEFFSVIDGRTGRELARANDIPRGTDSWVWGDNYWKRASSLRLGIASFNGERPQIFLARGVYARTVAEGWDYTDGQLTRLWHFDTSDASDNQNKDGKPNSAYAGQGNHSFSVADLDGDGRDEVMYGSMAIDDDGYGLWSTGLGHGDAQHVGKFLPDREGLQVYHCLESGTTMVALHDSKDGSIIWEKASESNNDMGRCCVGDIDPDSPGCEFWYAGGHAFSQDGEDLGYKPASCNMMIWWDGTLTRQFLNEGTIQNNKYGRAFTIYRYGGAFINGSKSNPGWYGDILGDWREEMVLADPTMLQEMRIFSTWYPTEYKFPWLMTDHTYQMSALNENVGYNQPTHTGYYIGSDLMETPIAPEMGNTTTPLPDDEVKAWLFNDFAMLPATIKEAATYDNLYFGVSESANISHTDGCLSWKTKNDETPDASGNTALLSFKLPAVAGNVIFDFMANHSQRRVNLKMGDQTYSWVKSINGVRTVASLPYNGSLESDAIIWGSGIERSHVVYGIVWVPDGLYETVTIGATGFATYCPPANVKIPSGLKVWYISGIDGRQISLSQASGVLPALSGVLLQGTPGKTYVFTKTTDKATALTGNQLIGTFYDTTQPQSDAANLWFALALNNDGQPAFLPVNPANPIPPFKAYFKVPMEQAARSYVFNDATGINNMTIQQSETDTEFFDLQGRKIGAGKSLLKKGFYIYNGKKIIIK